MVLQWPSVSSGRAVHERTETGYGVPDCRKAKEDRPPGPEGCPAEVEPPLAKRVEIARFSAWKRGSSTRPRDISACSFLQGAMVRWWSRNSETPSASTLQRHS